MLIKFLILFLLWLVFRRLWRLMFRRPSTSTSQRPRYPGPGGSGSSSRNKNQDGKKSTRNDITDQEISEAEFEELDD